MDIVALLTSAGINIAVCVVIFSLYSILRKQPSNVNVYFARRLASQYSRQVDFWLERFVPSPGWILKAWETSENEILAIGGLDAVVFVRIVVFSIRVFSITGVICTVLVLPVNYYGKDRLHKHIPLESLDVFTIENVEEGSKWLWAHCLALYIITLAACTLLYFEYKSITKLRLLHITGSPPSLSHFTILVRSIPWSISESYCDTVNKFFSQYHASTYLSHQMIYKCGKVQKLKDGAEHMCKVLKDSSENSCKPGVVPCCCLGNSTDSFKMVSNEMGSIHERTCYTDIDTRKREFPAAFVFFKSRYAALMAAQTLQTSNPMLWATDMAPEPHDVHWSNIRVPYRQIWIRKMATFSATIAFMLVFIVPVGLVQGLTQLEKLQKMFPFLAGVLKNQYVRRVVTGYLPSVILVLFLCFVPPLMMLFSTVEGPISRSGRKKSACWKVLYFTIWNVFFINVLTGSLISQLSVFSSLKELPATLAKAVPAQGTFFTTYILSSGWASLGFELLQVCPLLYNLFQRFLLRVKDDTLNGITFPYHTEVPRLLLFGFLGFTCSILAPLMLPFLLIYFFLAYLVYRNQIINVYITKYDSGGQYWPIAHNATVCSLLFAQLIALGVFGLKRSTVSAGFIAPLLIVTILFHQYCRKRFLPVFRSNSAQILIDLDKKDEQCGRMEEIYEQLRSAYKQPMPHAPSPSECSSPLEDKGIAGTSEDIEKGVVIKQTRPGPIHRTLSPALDISVLGGNQVSDPACTLNKNIPDVPDPVHEHLIKDGL
ncbi:putative calcium-dependent channel, 7TM region phosphate [Medicago truncatula]|uniref:ERD (Early-responsive to dehydration stress) family protein n=1 Tax=Medicago truncatula TaxID=3880 RepID=A0A072VEF6_MEDTR|nr:CSC1-like protein RXW8 [Medicago truncatula]XP_039688452.1 CSC1-like protein RXW8 [Medicago truncatula]KEH39976.1 ERD (early-responsive to dehydration stress) family protein [Medicago truncatula]RHN77186.1 putative calcium-dependent channel, 7TM region phosphate [Medicago truncatula]